jgi:hypothetical protein
MMNDRSEDENTQGSGQTGRFTAQAKRRLSSKEDSTEKKAHTDDTIMDREDIKDALRAVLHVHEENMSEMLAKAFDSLMIKVTTKVDDLDERDQDKEVRLTRVEERIDRQTQDSRVCNIIVTGLAEADLSKERMIRKLNKFMECDLAETDIKWVQRLVTDEGSTRRGKSKLRVVFKEEQKREDVFKLKSKLKGHDLWITDDLTALNSNLAYLARQALARRKIKKTWVYSGRIFIVKNGDDRPIRIIRRDEIPN